MRFAVDTGGTFTDLLVEDGGGELRMYKASTTPKDPIEGILNCLDLAAVDRGVSRTDLLQSGEFFIHGTTHPINAVLTGNTARTAFLTTSGHPDVLVFREGGRTDLFNFTVPYPKPYVPRSLTFELPERIMGDGSVRARLDEAAVLAVIEQLKKLDIEAIGVCLLWSIVNPQHEQRVGELLAKHLPSVPFTLSHRLNPSLREYRRASSTCIDASLKPMMQRYVGGLTGMLRRQGFVGRVLMVTSQAGVMDAGAVAEQPIQLINSGPSMAPVAGWLYASNTLGVDMTIVADTGGTSFDVSLVRRGRIPRTRETWIGPPFLGHMTGLPSVDVKSIGAGGGSIASVDSHGLLQVGPRSASALPGPVCYGRGGKEPTVTDASLVLGYLDPDFFLGGAIKLDQVGARAAIEETIAHPMKMGVLDAAHAIVAVATENMVQAIMDITVNQGIDPREAILIGGGGAAGLNIVMIGRRLGVKSVIVPPVGAALSAAGALLSDLASEHRAILYLRSAQFDHDAAGRVLKRLEQSAREFLEVAGQAAKASEIEFHVEARYPDQVWEIEVPLGDNRLQTSNEVAALEQRFHEVHEELFAVSDPHSSIEIVGWNSRASCRLRDPGLPGLGGTREDSSPRNGSRRKVYFGRKGHLETPVRHLGQMKVGEGMSGPLIVESPFTTVVIDPGSSCSLSDAGSLIIDVTGLSEINRDE
jgi:N-methylhydantoinase A